MLNCKIKALEIEINDLDKKKRMQVKQIEKLNGNIENLKQDKECLELKNSELEKEIDHLLSRIADIEQQNSKLHHALTNALLSNSSKTNGNLYCLTNCSADVNDIKYNITINTPINTHGTQRHDSPITSIPNKNNKNKDKDTCQSKKDTVGIKYFKVENQGSILSNFNNFNNARFDQRLKNIGLSNYSHDGNKQLMARYMMNCDTRDSPFGRHERIDSVSNLSFISTFDAAEQNLSRQSTWSQYDFNKR